MAADLASFNSMFVVLKDPVIRAGIVCCGNGRKHTKFLTPN